jgi:hypothetical protein
MHQEDAERPLVPSANGGQRALRAPWTLMHKRPLPKLVFPVDSSTLKYAPVENSIVYKLRHVIPYPPLKPKPYVPIMLVEDIVTVMRRTGASDEEIAEIRQKNRYVVQIPKPKPKKTHKKKKAADDDLDKVFSQFTTKPAVKKKVLKAVVKKI